jgi:hypothetical protein
VIVVDRPQLESVLAGREVTLDPDPRYRVGRTYALGLTSRRTVCRVEVVANGDRLRVRMTMPDSPRLLGRTVGYVELDPANPGAAFRRAMFSEPEPIDEYDLQCFTEAAHRRHEARAGNAVAQKRARSLAIRVKEAGRRCDGTELVALGAEVISVGRELAGTALA